MDFLLDFGWKKNYSRTFKPNKKLQSDGAQHLKEYAEATLGTYCIQVYKQSNTWYVLYKNKHF